MRIAELNNIFWTSVDIGMRLARTLIESVGDVLIAPVIVRAAERWTCVIFFTRHCEPFISDGEPAENTGFSQTLAAYNIFGTATERYSWRMSLGGIPWAGD